MFLFSSVSYAQLLPPICQNGKIAYFNQFSAYVDFCRVGLKAPNPQACDAQLEKLEKEGKLKEVLTKFYEKRDKEVCGDK